MPWSNTVISYCARLCVVLLVGTVGAPASAAGQSTSRVGGALTLGVTPNLAEGFSNDQLCRKRSGISASARVTFALTRIIQVEALGEVFNGPGVDCISAPVPPVPPSGPYTQTFDFYEARITNPPTVLSLRVGRTIPNAGMIALRPYVGIARFAGKGLTTPQAGLSILGGGSRLRLLLEVEGWWYSVPNQHLEEEFFDGQLVRRSLTEHGVRTFTTIFRLGFASTVGRG